MDATHSEAPHGQVAEVAPPALTAEQRAYIDGLRDLVDYLDAHPEAAAEINGFATPTTIFWYCRDLEALADATRTLGRGRKGSDENFLTVDREFGPHRIHAYAGHGGVCERIVVGTKTVTKEIPDPEALKQVPTVTVTEEREVVEWRCPPSLLAGAES